MVKRNSKANPEVAAVTPIPVSPDKEDGQGLDDSQPLQQTASLLLPVTPLQKTVSLQAMEAVAGVLLTPASGGKKATEPRTAEPASPASKRSKPTPGHTPAGSPAGDLAIGGLQVGDKGKEAQEFHDAQEAAGKMDVDETQ